MSRAELSFKLPPASVPTFNDISPGKREKWKYLHLFLPFPRFSRNCDLHIYIYTFLYRSIVFEIFFFFFLLKKQRCFKAKIKQFVNILSLFISLISIFVTDMCLQNCIYFHDLLISTLITLQLPLEGFSIIGFLGQFLLSSTPTQNHRAIIITIFIKRIILNWG